MVTFKDNFQMVTIRVDFQVVIFERNFHVITCEERAKVDSVCPKHGACHPRSIIMMLIIRD